MTVFKMPFIKFILKIVERLYWWSLNERKGLLFYPASVYEAVTHWQFVIYIRTMQAKKPYMRKKGNLRKLQNKNLILKNMNISVLKK